MRQHTSVGLSSCRHWSGYDEGVVGEYRVLWGRIKWEYVVRIERCNDSQAFLRPFIRMESKQSTKTNASTTRLGRDLVMVEDKVGKGLQSEGAWIKKKRLRHLHIVRPEFHIHQHMNETGPDKNDGRISLGPSFTFISGWGNDQYGLLTIPSSRSCEILLDLCRWSNDAYSSLPSLQHFKAYAESC